MPRHSEITIRLRTTKAPKITTCNGLHVWKVYISDFTGGIHTDLRILPVDFTGGIQGEAFVDLRGSIFEEQ